MASNAARRSALLLCLVAPLSAELAASLPAAAADSEQQDRPLEDPRVTAAVDRAVEYLRREMKVRAGGYDSLAALAIVKSGRVKNDPNVAAVAQKIAERVEHGSYLPSSNHYYTAGIHLMLLDAIDSVAYRAEIAAIARYIMQGQKPYGGWYYPSSSGQGDTSITQYSLLGLWMASRADVDVPTSVWDRAAAWHVKYQAPDGGFVYHPPEGETRTTLTAAAIGSLYIARMHLYPDAGPINGGPKQQEAKSAKKKKKKVYRFLEPINLDDPDAGSRPARDAPKPSQKPTTPLSVIDRSIERAMNRLQARWHVQGDGNYVHYFQYAVERMAALANQPMIGEHDWYAEISDFLLRTQKADGSWSGSNGSKVVTSFAVLCLTRATARTLGHEPSGFGVGTGLMAGGRGLPDNLAEVQIKGGEVKTRKLKGPLDELLAELEKAKSPRVLSAQQAIVERVQIGSRQELIGQIDRLVTLARDPRPEVRRTALWALGRSDDRTYAPLMIEALKDDDLGVMVEARNALCTLSRRPHGFGLPDDPLAGLPEDATDQERQERIEQWQKRAVARWSKWYLTVRPYEERDDLTEQALLGGER